MDWVLGSSSYAPAKNKYTITSWVWHQGIRLVLNIKKYGRAQNMTAPFRPESGRRWRSRQRPERLCSPQCRARNAGLWGASCCRHWRRRSRWSSRRRCLRNGPQRRPGRGGEESADFTHRFPKYKIKLRQSLFGGVVRPHGNVGNTQKKKKPEEPVSQPKQMNGRGRER